MSEFTWQVNGEIDIKTSGVALLNDYKRLLFENEDLKHRITKLEAKQRWIPVSERLPELDQDVLAVVEGQYAIGHFYEDWNKKVYFSWNEVGAMMVATHWMTLSEPPEESENEPA